MPMLVNDDFAGVWLLGDGLEHLNDIAPDLALLISFNLGGVTE